ncbi:MAG: hypothetical protein SX243_17755 [Acidobacteriota bacterium]|nr:hypothetical protein [Acidobacteriota bacterium]
MSRPFHRFLALAVLLLWMAPGASALGLGLHHALDPHHSDSSHHHSGTSHHETGAGENRPAGDPPTQPDEDCLEDWARTATHGHSHDAEAEPDHGHEAAVTAPVSAAKIAPPLASALPQALTDTVFRSRPPASPPPGLGSPPPLFTAHCSLLL